MRFSVAVFWWKGARLLIAYCSYKVFSVFIYFLVVRIFGSFFLKKGLVWEPLILDWHALFIFLHQCEARNESFVTFRDSSSLLRCKPPISLGYPWALSSGNFFLVSQSLPCELNVSVEKCIRMGVTMLAVRRGRSRVYGPVGKRIKN